MQEFSMIRTIVLYLILQTFGLPQNFYFHQVVFAQPQNRGGYRKCYPLQEDPNEFPRGNRQSLSNYIYYINTIKAYALKVYTSNIIGEF